MLAALVSYVGGANLDFVVVSCTVVCTALCFTCQRYKWKTQDVLVLSLIGYMLVSLGFSDYPVYLWYLGIKGQIVPMLFFFLGSGALFVDNRMMEKMRGPIMFAMVVGLLLYFFPPGWYLAKRTAELSADAAEMTVYECTRLSSFWPWSYAMGYGSLFFLMYYARDFFKDRMRLADVACFTVAFAVLFFAQQRVSIAFMPIYLGILVVWGRFRHKGRLLWILLTTVVFSGGIYLWMINYADSGFVDYVLKRSVDSDDNMVSERFKMFAHAFNPSWFGEGFGKYGHAAYFVYDMKTICDCEYMRLVNELGFIGTSLFALVYMRAVMTAFKYIKYYMFEFAILLFFLLAMIGATPLENGPMQPFLLWYCMGRVYNSRLRITPPLQLWIANLVGRVRCLYRRSALIPCAV